MKSFLPKIIIVAILAGMALSPFSFDLPNAGGELEIVALTARAAEVNPPPESQTCFSLNPIGGGLNLTACLANVVNIAMWLVARALYFAGAILDLSLRYTLNMSTFVQQVTMVEIGWTIFRDLSNILFIFIILWTAIKTILGLEHDTMKHVMQIVIAALLINFSLYIAKAVIDASNILALHFYSLVVPGAGGSGLSGLNNAGGSLAGVFMQGLRLSTIYNSSVIGTLDFFKIIIVGVFGSILILTATWVFLAAAAMFILRTIELVFIMMLSPLAFISWVTPGMHHYTSEWWNKLFKQSFFAPAYMALTYVVGRAIQAGQSFIPSGTAATTSGTAAGLSATAFAQGAGAQTALSPIATALTATSADPSAQGVILNFIILIGMMIASLKIAHEFGAKGAETMSEWGNHLKGMGTGVIGRTAVKATGIRALDEKFRESYLGNTLVGKKIRDMTTGYLATKAKFGGHETAEETHEEMLERKAKLADIARVQGSHLFSGTQNTKVGAMDIAKNMRKVKADWDGKIAEKQQAASEARLAVEATPKDSANYADLVEKAKEAEKEVENEKAEKFAYEQEQSSQIQRLLARITSGAFAKEIPKEAYEMPEIMENVSLAQLNAVYNGDRLSDQEKEEMLAKRYGFIREAQSKFYAEGGPWEKYEAETSAYLKKAQERIGKIEALVGEFGEQLGVDMDDVTSSEESLQDFINSVKEKNPGVDASKVDIPILKKPRKPNLGDVDKKFRGWIRAMSEGDVDYLYKAFPDEVMMDPNVVGTIRYGHIDYARNSKEIGQADRDKIREKKTQDFIDGNDLAAGIGQFMPSYETFKNVFAGINQPLPSDWNSEQKYNEIKNSEDGQERWDDLKATIIRPKIKKLDIEGNYEQYMETFNGEQKAMRALGLQSLIEGISGKSQKEVSKSRGAVWQMPDYLDRLDRGIVQQFKDKDIDEIKVLMDHLLRRFKLHTEGKRKMSEANLDALLWIINDKFQGGQNFKNKENIATDLRVTLEEAERGLLGKSAMSQLPAGKLWGVKRNGGSIPESEDVTSETSDQEAMGL